MKDEYADACAQRMLAEDEAIAEQSIDIQFRGDEVVLRGEVESEQRRGQIVQRIAELVPGCKVINEIEVSHVTSPMGPEIL